MYTRKLFLGILHYEPIYGQDKLERIQNNDLQKGMQCQILGIEFCTIDSSTCKYLNIKQKEKYWSIVESLIKRLYNRHLETQKDGEGF